METESSTQDLTAKLESYRVSTEELLGVTIPVSEGPTESFLCLTRAVNDLRAENRIFRALLWLAWAKGGGYGDDGELQWNMIDFKRDTAQSIEAELHRIGLERASRFLATPEGKEWLNRL